MLENFVITLTSHYKYSLQANKRLLNTIRKFICEEYIKLFLYDEAKIKGKMFSFYLTFLTFEPMLKIV